ncbi:MAG: tetratricopeptide repeat protein [Caldilineaceae bacterium]
MDELALDVARLRGDFLDDWDVRKRPWPPTLAPTSLSRPRTHGRSAPSQRHGARAPAALAAAWRTAHQARYQAEHLHGLILEQQGDMDAAEQHYITALDLATTAGDDDARAEANRCLCNLYGRCGELGGGVPPCRRRHRPLHTHGQSSSNGVGAQQSGRGLSGRGATRRGVGHGAAGLRVFLRTRFYPLLGGHGLHLAEAHFELGNWECSREHYADLALRAEEPLAIPYAAHTLALVQQARGNATAGMRWLDLCRSMPRATRTFSSRPTPGSRRLNCLVPTVGPSWGNKPRPSDQARACSSARAWMPWLRRLRSGCPGRAH